ncbi:MAG TPA: UbiA family prenyltransferase [Burkholderiales bacterium]|nr:UbiA family prenyltransferase [Burkholderiales bacterium]
MSVSATPFPVTSWGFWRAYGVTLRPYLLFVSGVSGLLGLALGDTLHGLPLAVAAVPFFISYGLGQAITDTFQTDTDALSSPFRPLVRGEIARGPVLALSLGGLLLIALLYAFLNPWTLMPAALAVAGVVLYTPFKRHWWGGPPWNSWIVATLPLLGVLLGGGTPAEALARPETWLAMGSVYFSYAVFVLLGYFKDVEADRATGYDTIVVHFGRRLTLRVSALHAVLALVCSVALVRIGLDATPPGWAGLVGGGLWLGGAVALAVAHVRIAGTIRDAEAHPAVALVVVGYVALHLGEATLLRPGFGIAAALVFPLCLLMLARRPEKTQV